ncbi:T9SS type A sorting domain-containing protein, partial [Candidatus Latescibacterota bacterium]
MDRKKALRFACVITTTFIVVCSICGNNDTVYGNDISNHQKLQKSTSVSTDSNQSQRVSPPYLTVHYKPWFESPEVRENWGGHWTMANCNPDSIFENGQRQIASHYYPLTGPYDSSDDRLLEYHVLLMKLSGIDGVIADWYGNEELYDYGQIHESTNDLFEHAKKAQLKFSICYEDQAIKSMVDTGSLAESEIHNYGQSVLSYAQNNWFNDDTYLKIPDQPVLLNNTVYLQDSSDWDAFFSVLDTAPLFFPLSTGLDSVSAGRYAWVPWWVSANGVISEQSMNDYLANLYYTSKNWDHLVAGAWPGYHDYYFDGGYGFTHGSLDSQDGNIFESTLQSAINSNPDIIQVVTWNDFGEGTNIEPTAEYGYKYLEMLQDFRREHIDSSFSYQPKDLEIPLQIFNLRKEYRNVTAVNDLLDQAFDSIISGDLNSAAAIIENIPRTRQEWILNNRANPPYIMVHYMPWFQTPEVRGWWGGHWTLGTCNPDLILPNGQRQIASHFYPLTGPYDTSDTHILEYQVLLMRLSGIDGVMPNWYGNEDYYDYGLINESTNDLFEYAKKAHLKFLLSFTDAPIKEMVDNGDLSEKDAHNYGQEVMLYIQDNWFNDDTYLKISDKPVLLNWGPIFYHESTDWDTLFSALDTTPLFFNWAPQPNTVIVGGFAWPPMGNSTDGVLSEETLNDYLTEFYYKSEAWDHFVAGAWPGFHDYYLEGGYGFTYGYLDSQDGIIFESTLQSAINSNPDIIQLVTWNDYGEGTNIEPTVEYGYQYLEKIQNFRREYIDSSFSYKPEDLEKPLQIFNLRKAHKGTESINAMLDQAFDFIISGELNSAVAIIEEISNSTVTPPTNVLVTDVPEDNGHSTHLTWTLSTDDASLSHYYIYRSRNSEFSETYVSIDSLGSIDALIEAEEVTTVMIATVPRGTSTYTDNSIPLNGVNYYYWIQSVSESGSSKVAPASGYRTSVESAPSQFGVSAPYPNPFNASTTIKYSLPADSYVILTVYNVSGQVVSVLKNELQSAGHYSFTWNATDMPSGLYFVTVV